MQLLDDVGVVIAAEAEAQFTEWLAQCFDLAHHVSASITASFIKTARAPKSFSSIPKRVISDTPSRMAPEAVNPSSSGAAWKLQMILLASSRRRHFRPLSVADVHDHLMGFGVVDIRFPATSKPHSLRARANAFALAMTLGWYSSLK